MSAGGFNYAAFEAARRKEREAELAAERRAEAAVAALAADPAAQLEARRKRYSCAARYVASSAVQPWSAYAHALAPLPQHTTVGSSGSRGGGGAPRGLWASPNDSVAITPSDVAMRREPAPALNEKIAIFQGDITALEVDAIVNAANESLLGGGGIDGAIHRAAGPLLLAECETLGGCGTGQTKLTKGYALPARYVLHTVGPIGGGNRKLRSCYETCLALARAHELRTIAFCCVSTGVFGFPLVKATHIALSVVRDWLEEPANAAAVDKIIFCVFRDAELECYERIAASYFPVPGALPTDQSTRPLAPAAVSDDECDDPATARHW